jgi:hypothetical protein
LEVHRLLIHTLYQLVNKKYLTYQLRALRMLGARGVEGGLAGWQTQR